MVVEIENVAIFDANRFIYAETCGAYVHLYLEGLHDDYISISTKTQAKANEILKTIFEKVDAAKRG